MPRTCPNHQRMLDGWTNRSEICKPCRPVRGPRRPPSARMLAGWTRAGAICKPCGDISDISVAGMTELPPGTDHAVLVASVMAAVRGFSGYRGVPHLKVNWVGRYVNGGPHANKKIPRPPSYVALWQQMLAEASEDEDEDGADLAGEPEELCLDDADAAIEDAHPEELGMEEEGMEEQGMVEQGMVEEPQGLALIGETGTPTDQTDLAEPEGPSGDDEAGAQLEDQRQVEQPLALTDERSRPTFKSTRGRLQGHGLCPGLPDQSKAAPKNRCALAMLKQGFSVGDAVNARYSGARGGAWFAGRVTGVSELSAEQGGPAWTYDIAYNDGDQSQGLKAQYVRA